MMNKPVFTCGVLTVSDKGFAGSREDTSGPALRQMLLRQGFAVDFSRVVPDDGPAITAVLKSWADEEGLDLIVTTGGTGVAPRDVTPEATGQVIDREVPGLAEAMRRESFRKTVHAVLSRGVAGIRKRCLIVNLPGSERAARENLDVILPALPHALEKIRGDEGDCGILSPCTKRGIPV